MTPIMDSDDRRKLERAAKITPEGPSARHLAHITCLEGLLLEAAEDCPGCMGRGWYKAKEKKEQQYMGKGNEKITCEECKKFREVLKLLDNGA